MQQTRFLLAGLRSLVVLALVILTGCASVATRPAEELPLVEIEIQSTPETIDDAVFPEGTVGARARLANHTRFSSAVPVWLQAFETEAGGRITFGASGAIATAASLSASLPEDGSWFSFLVRGKSASSRERDVAIEVRERRTSLDGTILARAALTVTKISPPVPKARVEVQLHDTAATLDDYLTWSPSLGRARLVSPPPGSASVPVLLRNGSGAVGQLRFAANGSLTAHAGTATGTTLSLSLPGNGDWVSFYVAGAFGSPSIEDKDALLEVTSASGDLLARLGTMVRVRKNANTMQAVERDRFLEALAVHNGAFGLYPVYQSIHGMAWIPAHTNPSFLPWHRVLLLRLERELQAIDPSVSLPYWKFDEPAPNLFTADFLGATSSSGLAAFSPGNPLSTWTINGLSGIRRTPSFAASAAPNLSSQTATLALGGTGAAAAYASFRSSMEGNPHGQAHVQAGAGPGDWLFDPNIAARDPLFFLLHCNVDRLWAAWQWTHDRIDPLTVTAYLPQGTYPGSPGDTARLGTYVGDNMWPWNEATGNGDPATSRDDWPSAAPGGPFPQVLGQIWAPIATPRPSDVIDYRSSRVFSGVNDGLGFAYADINY
jgi:tyrosinase